MTTTATTGTALVQVTIEVELTQPWDGASTLDDVRARAVQEARDRVREHPEIGVACWRERTTRRTTR